MNKKKTVFLYLSDAVPGAGVWGAALSADLVLAGQQQPLVDGGVVAGLGRTPAGARAVAHTSRALHR